jgi:hypothetical protein
MSEGKNGKRIKIALVDGEKEIVIVEMTLQELGARLIDAMGDLGKAMGPVGGRGKHNSKGCGNPACIWCVLERAEAAGVRVPL